MPQADPVVAKYKEQFIDSESGEPVAKAGGVQVRFSVEALPDYTLMEGVNIAKNATRVKEIRQIEADNLALLREQEPFTEAEPQPPKDQTPAAQRAYQQAHGDWDARRLQYEEDLRERSRILVEDPEHKDMYLINRSQRPVYRDVEMIEILVPADTLNIPKRPVTPQDIAENRAQYNRWKAGQAQQIAGTPLEQLAGMTKSLVKELHHFNVTTVEQLAETSDSNLQRVGPLLAFRKKAQDWVKTAKGMAPVQEARDEARRATEKARNLEAQIADLKRQMSELKK